ncbi:MAG: DUF2905 domain-containing protein [Deltaproteobacteria bacterium]|nr:DUF2905 domain-containing protein [Deltaproteobacteria bacterium]
MSGRALIIIGVVLVVIGFFLTYGPRIPYLGKLPGDIYYKKGSFTFYFPLATSIIVSIVLSVILYFINRR